MTVAADEEDWDPDGLAYDLEVARGMRSNRTSQRTSTELIWRAIADGKAHASTTTRWAEHVARQMVDVLIDNQDLDDKLRGRAALRALGLYDKKDRYAELRDFIETWMSFHDLSKPEPQVAIPPRSKDILRAARARGMFKGVDNRPALERVRRQIYNVMERKKGIQL